MTLPVSLDTDLSARHATCSRKAVLVTALASLFFLSSCASHPRSNPLDWFKPAIVTWNDTQWCVPWQIQGVLIEVSRRFGPVTVWSSHRWPLENMRKGGKSKSYHLSCRAADFMVKGGNPKAILEFLKTHPGVGGYSYYPKGFFHIDNGPKRTW